MSRTAKSNEPRQSPPDLLSRQMPHNLEAEMALLGSMLIDPEGVIPVCVKRTVAHDFYQPAHGTIFELLVELHSQNQPADIVTLTQALRDRKQLDAVGGPAYITSLIGFTPTAANAAAYLDILSDLAAKRQIIVTASALVEQAYCPGAELSELDASLHALAANRSKAASTGTTVVDMKELTIAALVLLR